MYLFLFLFNATATTESYTDLHTLSLHDALPISTGARVPRRASRMPGTPRMIPMDTTGLLGGRRTTSAERMASRTPGAAVAESSRSEEHTSELQSLMRISYAVFCLKKKK